MLKDGQKGVILQRDKTTYGIAPHIPCGMITADMLEKLAAVAKKYPSTSLKITSAARIAIFGLLEEEVDNVWKELGFDQGHATGLCVRSVKVCPGTTFCRLAKQDSLDMGMRLDQKYHGTKQPSKMKMAVSGCKIQCGENCIKDLSLYGTETGWTVLVGGMGGIKPRLADILVENVPSKEVENILERTLAFYRDYSKRVRLGFIIEKIGIEALRDGILST